MAVTPSGTAPRMGTESPSAAAPASTLRGFSSGLERSTVWLRRGAVAVLTLVLIAALLGYLGLRTQTANGSGHGYRLSVQYPAVARAGLDIVWNVEVQHPGGFGKQITLRLTSDYADILEQQGLSPQPSDETQDGQWDYLTFSAPPGDTFDFGVDAYIQPASQQGRSAEIAVVDAQRRPLVSVSYRTRLLP